jgi:hypothetical protein
VLISMRLELPKTLHRLRLQRRFLSRSMVVLFKIEGNFPCLRARSAHMVGNLPPTPLRTTEFAPAISLSKRPATSIASPTPTSASGYGPPATATSWKAGRFTGADFPLQPDGTLQCPAGHALHRQERRREADGSLRVVYAASLRDCRPCPLREQCQWEGHETRKPRQVSVRLASAAGGSCTAALARLEPPSPSASLYAVGA